MSISVLSTALVIGIGSLPICLLDGATKVASDAETNTKPDKKKDEGSKLSKMELAILDLTNKERENAGLAPIKADEKLFKVARAHSANMAQKERLGHVLDGKDLGGRLRDVDYSSSGWGENCAAGQTSAKEVVATWMRSAGHRGNILNSRYSEIGIGETVNGTLYYTQVFATPR